MQCHRCPKDGRPDEACLSCRCAEYLDNDHKTVSPVGDFAAVGRRVLRVPKADPFPNTPRHVVRDCANVLEELKHCHPDSFPHLFRLFALFVTTNAALLTGVLQGRTRRKCSVASLWHCRFWEG